MNCILMSGLPASGKSTVAGRLSKEFGYPVISKDRLKEILFDNVGFDCHESKRKLDRASTRTMFYIAEMFMSNGMPFILDNNFENSTGPEIAELIDRYGYNAVTVRLHGDTEAFIRRYNDRNGTDERHRGHAVNTRYPEGDEREPVQLATPESFEKYVERGMDSFHVGEVVPLDTTDLGSVDYGGLFTRVRSRLGEADA